MPRPGPVTIDGKLDDWDLSGQIWMWVTLQTAEMQGARFAMMYDDQALYVSAVVRDPHPLMNRHDPLVDPESAWDADVCQLRLMLDPKAPVSVLECRRWEPERSVGHDESLVLHRSERTLPVASAPATTWWCRCRARNGRKGWCRTISTRPPMRWRPINLGYTFEYRLPWSTLGVKTVPEGRRYPGLQRAVQLERRRMGCTPPAAAPGLTM